jgi:hypothetical protein
MPGITVEELTDSTVGGRGKTTFVSMPRVRVIVDLVSNYSSFNNNIRLLADYKI